MPALTTLLLLAALVCFAIPAIRAILGRSFDYTNTGLACFIATLLLG
jgi:hypothetical protein